MTKHDYERALRRFKGFDKTYLDDETFQLDYETIEAIRYSLNQSLDIENDDVRVVSNKKMKPDKYKDALDALFKCFAKGTHSPREMFGDDFVTSYYEEIKEAFNLAEKYEQLRKERDELAQFIVVHESSSFYGDHACRECYPYSDMLVDGFICGLHKAKKATENGNT